MPLAEWELACIGVFRLGMLCIKRGMASFHCHYCSDGTGQ
jgi:hypothetical protein